MFFAIRGVVEDFVPVTDETTQQVKAWRLSLLVPGVRQMVFVDLPLDAVPTEADQRAMEDDRRWVEVSAIRFDLVRDHLSDMWNGLSEPSEPVAEIIFTGLSLRDLSAEERQAMAAQRKALKAARIAARRGEQHD